MIRGEKVVLRAIEPEDGEDFHKFINDEESNKTRGVFHPMSKTAVFEYLKNESTNSSEKLTFAIEDAKDRKLLGLIGLRGVCGRSRRAEIWIYIGKKEKWGSGFGKDALSTLIRYAFDQMNLHRIWLECDPSYEKIMAAYEKVGFVKEGTLRDGYFRHGEYRNTCMMSILSTDETKTESSI